MVRRSPTITFHFQDVPDVLDGKRKLKGFIANIFAVERKQLSELTFVFCTDNRLRRLNRDYLDHDYFTDVLAFDLSTGNDSIKGEVYVSIDRVRENARIFGASFQHELHRVIFHGSLHLCGYSDKKKMEEKRIHNQEDKLLRKYLRKNVPT